MGCSQSNGISEELEESEELELDIEIANIEEDEKEILFLIEEEEEMEETEVEYYGKGNAKRGVKNEYIDYDSSRVIHRVNTHSLFRYINI